MTKESIRTHVRIDLPLKSNMKKAVGTVPLVLTSYQQIIIKGRSPTINPLLLLHKQELLLYKSTMLRIKAAAHNYHLGRQAEISCNKH